MEDIFAEADFIYYTLASVATLIFLAVGWKVLSGRETQSSKPEKCTEVCKDKPSTSPAGEDLPDVDNVLIKASEIEAIDPTEVNQTDGQSHDTPTKNVRIRARELEEELKKDMTADQMDEERRVREEQLSAIFKLMQANEERFGVDSMEDVKNQYSLYA